MWVRKDRIYLWFGEKWHILPYIIYRSMCQSVYFYSHFLRSVFHVWAYGNEHLWGVRQQVRQIYRVHRIFSGYLSFVSKSLTFQRTPGSALLLGNILFNLKKFIYTKISLCCLKMISLYVLTQNIIYLITAILGIYQVRQRVIREKQI